MEGSKVYKSHILRSFLQKMSKHSRVQLLDLGSVCGPNLEFFGRQGFKIFAEDILANLRPPPTESPRLRTRRRRKKKIEMPAVQPFLHPDEKFQGVLCWDVFDFLNREEATLLAREVYRVLAPGGFTLNFFNSRKVESAEFLYRYRILDPDSLDYTQTGTRRLIRHAYQNRDIMQIFEDFRIESFFYLRNRMREVLTYKPA